jgi:hypothetical protein
MPKLPIHGAGLLMLVGLAASAGGATPVCEPLDARQLRCTIERVADCEQILDYPYARNLFCPAAFRAAKRMAATLAKQLGIGGPTRQTFYYFQTLADPDAPPEQQAQTTVACLDTPAPFTRRAHVVIGAGTPLCHLVAFATSPGPVGPEGASIAGNPVPTPLRDYPGYFRRLFDPMAPYPLGQFRTGSLFDPLVANLGTAGRAAFLADYPKFSPTRLYDPRRWLLDRAYQGISGGGGGGWGGEIGVLTPTGERVHLFAFGGGGGGGMTSTRTQSSTTDATARTRVGAGGGGGVQFANGYVSADRSYNGLGLGAGFGSEESEVQYTYNDYAGSGRRPRRPHRYDERIIADYRMQLKHLHEQLRTRYESGVTVILTGGGGMGAGTEYLMRNGQEYEPHALSTQAGFLFDFEFDRPGGNDPPVGVDPNEEDVYEHLGEDFRVANQVAYEACGRDYGNFACMCPKQHATVLCLLAKQIGDPAKIPSWLQQPHCGGESEEAVAGDAGFSSYQQVLLDAAEDADEECRDTVRAYLTEVNTPSNAVY